MKLKNKNIYIIACAVVLVFSVSSCTKDVPQELLNNGAMMKSDQTEMPDDEIHGNIRQGFEHAIDQDTENSEDEKKANQMMKQADDADLKYMKSKSEQDKLAAIELHMLTANFMMLEANLAPRKKYRPAYRRYKRILELDPGNEEANYNKQLIEDIYIQMGMEVPEED